MSVPLAAVLLACAPARAAAQEAKDDAPYSPHVEPASGEGEAAIAGFQPAEGIEIELFAAEPMLANPVCFYVDDQGDFYVGETFRHYAGVTDMREHMDWLDEDLANQTVEDRRAMLQRHEGENYDAGYATASERIRLIRDTDGDGKADTAVVFADDFRDHAAGIGAGVLSYRGSVYYTCIPDLWLLRDVDGDGRADERKKLSTGYGINVALLGHDLHGLRIGPDRRLYFSSGDRGFRVETEHGTVASPKTGAVLRCNLDGSGLEIWHSGLRNPQELVFDELGDLWTGDNNSDGGDEARWVNVVEGGDSGWRYPYQWITEPVQRGPWNDEKLWYPPFAGQAAYIVPPVANIAHGPSGLTYYPGTGLSPAYAGHFFLCDFRGDAAYSGIHTFTVAPKGAFWELGPVTPFVWNTLVTDCDFGPDGALYFTDWVEGWNKTGKGRIYRAFDPAGRASALTLETRDILGAGMGERSIDALVELLRHPDQRVRQEAEFELVDRGADGSDALREVALHDTETIPRLHAIWGLGIIGRAGDPETLGTLVPLTRDADPEVRAQAVRVLGDERFAEGAQAIQERLADDAPRVRFFAALAAGRLGPAMPADTVEMLAIQLQLTRDSDPNLRHALVMGLRGCASEAELDRLSLDDSPDVQMAVLLVRRRNADPDAAQFLASPDPRLVLEAARAIHDVPIPAALPVLADLELPAGAPAALVRRVMNANYRLGLPEPLAALALRDDLDEALRVEALDMLADWEAPSARDRVLNAWRPIAPRDGDGLRGVASRLAEAGIGKGPDDLVRAFTRFAAASRAEELGGLFVEWTEASERSSEVRTAALEALLRLGAPELPAVVRMALGDPDGSLRAAALSALEELSPGEALPSLPPILELGELGERRAAYRILARSTAPQAAELLKGEMEKLAADLLPAELELDLVEAVEAHDEPELAALLERHRSPRQRDPALAPYLDGLFGGDRLRGRAVFRRIDLSCVRCHKAEEGAEQIGPNLEDVSSRLSRLQVLESIVAPNRRTSPGFSSTVLFLEEGGVVNGRIVEDSDTVVRVLNADGEIIEVDPAEIEERRPDLSAMPEDLATGISREEMRDLLEYLSRL